MNQRYWPAIFFLSFCSVLVWFWYQDNGGLGEWIWEASLFSCLEKFEKDSYQLFICLEKFPWEATWSLTLFVRSVVITDLISVLVITVFRLSVPSWSNLGGVYVSRSLYISSRLSNLLAHDCNILIICISVILVIISPFSFPILSVWVLFFLNESG